MFAKKPSATASATKDASKPKPDRSADRTIEMAANMPRSFKPTGASLARSASPPLTAGNRPGHSGAQSKIPPIPREKDESMNNHPSKTSSTPTFRSDFRNEPARRDPAGSRNQDSDTGRRLVVGREISLNGEISTCDCLVVEGTVEASVREGRRIEIGETGLFKGTIEIEEADIAGTFEGDITVRGRLVVRATGVVTGKVQYGELEIEAGGCINGTLSSMKPATTPAAKTQMQARPAMVKTGPERLQADLASETA